MASFGSIDTVLLLLGAGIVVLGGALLAQYLGVTSFLNFFGTMWSGFMETFGRIISLAPKPIKILVFIVLGAGVLGLIANWFIAGDVVCNQCQPYKSDSFLSATMGKFMNSGATCQGGSVSSTATSVQLQSSAKTDKEVQSISQPVYGTYVAYGKNIEASGGSQTLNSSTLYWAVPSEFTVDKVPSIGQVYNFAVCQKKGDTFNFGRDDLSDGMCYLSGSETPIMSCDSMWDTQLAFIHYQLSSAKTATGEKVVAWKVQYTYPDGHDVYNLSLCQSGTVPGGYKLYPGSSSVSNDPVIPGGLIPGPDKTTLLNPADETGVVSVKYLPVSGVVSAIMGGSGADGVGISSRTQWLEREGNFKRLATSAKPCPAADASCLPQEGEITYVCRDGEEDAVQVNLMGIDAFSFKTMMILMVFIGILTMLKYFNLFG